MGLCGLTSDEKSTAGTFPPSPRRCVTTGLVVNCSESENSYPWRRCMRFDHHPPPQEVKLETKIAGKTSLLNVFTRGFFPEAYEPTVFENCTSPPRTPFLRMFVSSGGGGNK